MRKITVSRRDPRAATILTHTCCTSSTCSKRKVYAALALFCVCAFLLSPASIASPELSRLSQHVVLVRSGDEPDADTMTGVVVRSDAYNGYVVIPADFPDRLSKLNVVIPGTGAELVAQVISRDSERDLALLKVNGLDLPAVTFASQIPGPGDLVWSLSATSVRYEANPRFVGITRGNITSVQELNDELVLHHSAQPGEVVHGAPLLDECFSLVGINFVTQEKQRALAAGAIIGLVGNHNLAVSLAGSQCVSPLQQARVRAEEANAAAEAARAEAQSAQQTALDLAAKLKVTNEKNQRLLVEAARAQSTADDAIEAAREAQQHAQQTRLALEKQTAALAAETAAMVEHLNADRAAAEAQFRRTLLEQQQQASTRENYLLTAFAVFCLVLIAGFVLLQRWLSSSSATAPAGAPKSGVKNPQKADLAAVTPAALATEYVLEGRDEEGISYMLHFAIEQAGTSEGVVIGRNPEEAAFVLNHIDVSRRHARIKLLKGQLHIEDLGSTNSTTLNGEDIADQGPVAVKEGDLIVFGAVQMKLRGKANKVVISK